MKIETKYDLGQEVWLMWNNKATKRKIARVEVQVEDGEQYEVYDVAGLEGGDGALFDCTYELEDLFLTKEELLKSL